jgi:hypothetical protein
MSYAGKETDKRQLGTFKFWGITILVAAVTAIMTACCRRCKSALFWRHNTALR